MSFICLSDFSKYLNNYNDHEILRAGSFYYYDTIILDLLMYKVCFTSTNQFLVY